MANKHLSAEEKEIFVLRYKSNPNVSFRVFCKANNLPKSSFCEWINKYEQYGIVGLQRAGKRLREDVSSLTSSTDSSTQKQIKDLKTENLRLRIEIERLKKNYTVREREDGRMEYVPLRPKNSK